MWRWQSALAVVAMTAAGSFELAAQSPPAIIEVARTEQAPAAVPNAGPDAGKAGPSSPVAAAPAAQTDQQSPDRRRDDVGRRLDDDRRAGDARSMPRRRARNTGRNWDGRDWAGRDWPLDQSRTFRGPRDAHGGYWIYVRPAHSPDYRNRYTARRGYGYEGRFDGRDNGRFEPRWRDSRFDRFPDTAGRRRDD